jgi:hypothetical protein
VDNSAFILAIPLIIISLLSIIKLIQKKAGNGKPWIRIEEVEEHE